MRERRYESTRDDSERAKDRRRGGRRADAHHRTKTVLVDLHVLVTLHYEYIDHQLNFQSEHPSQY